jgi:hypothetical protein
MIQHVTHKFINHIDDEIDDLGRGEVASKLRLYILQSIDMF